MVVFVPQFAQVNFKRAGRRFWTYLHHFVPFCTKSKSAILLGLIAATSHWTLKRVQKWSKIGVLRGFLTGPERVLGLKGRYIVTFGQEAVRGPQKGSKMFIFPIKNDQKSSKITKFAKMCIKTEGTNPRFP